MSKVKPTNWTEVPDPADYTSAADYLSLLLPEDTVECLRHGSMVVRRAKDRMRAGGLSTLPEDNPAVAKKLRLLKRGKSLPPVLCLRGDLHEGAPLTIADGYHRVCTSFIRDEGADIPRRLAELPRPQETLAGLLDVQRHRN